LHKKKGLIQNPSKKLHHPKHFAMTQENQVQNLVKASQDNLAAMGENLFKETRQQHIHNDYKLETKKSLLYFFIFFCLTIVIRTFGFPGYPYKFWSFGPAMGLILGPGLNHT